MSGENVNVYAPTFELASGGTGNGIASGVIGKATNAYALEANGLSYPDGTFALTCVFGGVPVENSVITLCAQLLGVDGGSKNTLVPEPSRLGRVIGRFAVDNVATEQTMALEAFDLPRNAAYWLFNEATGQTILAGWTLKVTPRTIKPAA
jgi:hypothetical protein